MRNISWRDERKREKNSKKDQNIKIDDRLVSIFARNKRGARIKKWISNYQDKTKKYGKTKKNKPKIKKSK